MRRSRLDKFIAYAMVGITIVLYVVDELVKDWIPPNKSEFKILIVFIGALSLFAGLWSTIWDNKIEKLNSNLSAQQKKLLNKQVESNKALKETVNSALRVQSRIESRILSECENDLYSFLEIDPASSEYARIYIATNDSRVETEDFGDAICRNIIHNHQYIYMTPFETWDFMEKLHDELFKTIPDGIDRYHLEAAFQKNIQHYSSPDFFKLLPAYSDMVVYTKNVVTPYSPTKKAPLGYYSFQNGPILINGVDCYYYNEMPDEMAATLISHLCSGIASQWDSSIKNFENESYVQTRNTSISGKGLFAVQTIPKGTIIFKKGGRFIERDKLPARLLSNIQYIQVSSKMVLSSINTQDDNKLGLPINHSCRNPNCGFSVDNPIAIVTTDEVKKDDELLIDYAFFNPSYQKFQCAYCKKGTCSRQVLSPDAIFQSIAASKDHFAPYLR